MGKSDFCPCGYLRGAYSPLNHAPGCPEWDPPNVAAASPCTCEDGCRNSLCVVHGDPPEAFGAPNDHGLAASPVVPTQPMPIKGKASVTRTLIQRLEDRELHGIRKYGRSLETWNGRDPVLDLMEELLDGIQYAQQWIMERDELLAKVKRLEEVNASTVAQSEHLIKDNERLRAVIRKEAKGK